MGKKYTNINLTHFVVNKALFRWRRVALRRSAGLFGLNNSLPVWLLHNKRGIELLKLYDVRFPCVQYYLRHNVIFLHFLLSWVSVSGCACFLFFYIVRIYTVLNNDNWIPAYFSFIHEISDYICTYCIVRIPTQANISISRCGIILFFLLLFFVLELSH